MVAFEWGNFRREATTNGNDDDGGFDGRNIEQQDFDDTANNSHIAYDCYLFVLVF